MNGFIDLHSHLAWDIDDGIPTEAMAEDALLMAQEDGIRLIALTPHFVPGQVSSEQFANMKRRMFECRRLADSYGIKIVFGSEVFIDDDFTEHIDHFQLPTLNGTKYILIEFDEIKDIEKNDNQDDAIHELIVRGYIPVIAHAERYFPNGVDLDLIRIWKDKGCLIQINRSSLMGYDSVINQNNAEKLLKEDLADLVATDTHEADGARIPVLSDCYKFIRRNYGKERAEKLLFGNPVRILKGNTINDVKPRAEVVMPIKLQSAQA